MKNIIAAFLCLLAVAGAARADRVLIYKGTLYNTEKSSTTSAKDAKTSNYAFFLFDIDTQQYASVYFTDVKGVKTYTVNGQAAFSDAAIQTTTNGSFYSNFAFGGTSTGSSFEYRLGIFTGRDSNLTIATGFSGEIAKVLTFSGILLSGDATVANDSELTISGVLDLNTTLTKANFTASGSSLSDATTVVTTYLASLHYNPAP